VEQSFPYQELFTLHVTIFPLQECNIYCVSVLSLHIEFTKSSYVTAASLSWLAKFRDVGNTYLLHNVATTTTTVTSQSDGGWGV